MIGGVDSAGPRPGPRSALENEPLSSLLFDLVTSTAARRPDAPSDEAVFYLMTLLERLLRGDVLPEKGETLAETFIAGLTEDPVRAEERLRLTGDRALVIAGLFPARFTRRTVTSDYIKRIGTTSFRRVARLAKIPALRPIYRELSARFNFFVGILEDIGEAIFPRPVPRSTLDLYERWIATESVRARDALALRGIIPVAAGSVQWQ
jgi:hypothetical protein